LLVQGGVGVAVLTGWSSCSPPAVLCPNPEGVCAETPSNSEGPYFREGAPERTSLNVLERPGDPIRLVGRVLSSDCRSPIAGATLDIWHADGDGVYDLDTQHFGLRGRITTNDNGEFAVSTIIPGMYWFGSMPRARHIHVRLAAPGHVALTTQLFFADDPWIHQDVQFTCGALVNVEPELGGSVGRYDFMVRKG